MEPAFWVWHVTGDKGRLSVMIDRYPPYVTRLRRLATQHQSIEEAFADALTRARRDGIPGKTHIRMDAFI